MFLRGIFLVSALAMISPAGAGELTVVDDNGLTKILSNFVILAEAKSPQSEGMWVRLLRVQDPGECGATLASCPMSTVYVAVSEYGEYPEQRVYRLPPRHYWQFGQWRDLPSSDGEKDFVVATLTAQQPVSPDEEQHWLTVSCTLKVNYRRGSFDCDR